MVSRERGGKGTGADDDASKNQNHKAWCRRLTQIVFLLIRVTKTDRQRERETANTVKSWVAEWEARNRLVTGRRVLATTLARKQE